MPQVHFITSDEVLDTSPMEPEVSDDVWELFDFLINLWLVPAAQGCEEVPFAGKGAVF